MNDEDTLVKRMEALNGKPLKNRPEPGAEIQQSEPVRRRRTPLRIREPEALESLAPGSEILTDEGETAYLVKTRVSVIDDDCRDLSPKLAELLADPDSPASRRLARSTDVSGLRVEDVVFMDIETTGLSNTPLFLIGVMLWEAGQLVVRQYLARNFDEESAAISLYTQHLKPGAWLVTFNGASFDVPYIRKRGEVHRIQVPSGLPHLDLLHVSRRAWGGRLPNCRLITLEAHVCGRERVGDIPSGEIPAAYRAFVRTGDATDVAAILTHNALDLVTLADLMTRLPTENVAPKRRYSRPGRRRF